MPEPSYLPSDAHLVKIAVIGPFAVGKTTLIRAVSEIESLHTEEVLTSASVAVDDLAGRAGKTTTTVGIDFGRLTLDRNLVLYLFGTPGQQRFRPLWEEIVTGSLGALVLADASRIAESFDALDLVEELAIPYALMCNRFPGRPRPSTEDVRASLDLAEDTPILDLDAREREDAVNALITLTRHAAEGANR